MNSSLMLGVVQIASAATVAAAAIAMWRATANLVGTTRELTLAAAEPVVRIDGPTQPICHFNNAFVTVTNCSRFAIDELRVRIASRYVLQNSLGQQEEIIERPLGNTEFGSLGPHAWVSLPLWSAARRAADDSLQTTARSIGLDLIIEYRHGITARRAQVTDRYGIQVMTRGQLWLSRLESNTPIALATQP